MITSFEIFENTKRPPQLDDYVICGHNWYGTPPATHTLENFLLNHIGKIILITDEEHDDKPYCVAYDDNDVPDDVKKMGMVFRVDLKVMDGDVPFDCNVVNKPYLTPKPTTYQYYSEESGGVITRQSIIYNCARFMRPNEILYYSKDREDMEKLLKQRQFDL